MHRVPYPIRPVAPEELRAFARVWERSFNFDERDEELALIANTMEFDRSFAALDGEEFVGTGSAFSFDLTTPGGQVPAGGLTAVAVAPTHRRRGILADLMRYHFDEVRGRGEPLSVLHASESGIYGRFGYGTATIEATFQIERTNAAFADELPGSGAVKLVDKDEAAKLLPGIYGRVAATRPGFLSRSSAEWENQLADLEHWREGRTSNRFAIYEEDGEARGYVRYRVRNQWEEGHASSELIASELMATTPAAEADLWRYLFSVDLIRTITAKARPTVELISLLLADPRRMKTRFSDGLWVRLLDVPAALQARRYQIDGRLVIEVTDRFLPEAGGVFALEGGPDRAECTAVEADPDLTVDATGLGSRYLGEGSFRLLHEAGRVRGHPEAVNRADLMFGWHQPPWCPHYF